MIKNIEIIGLRGFANKQSINFSKPNGKLGSGLSILVGTNNSGKSTIIEAIRAVTQTEAPSLSIGRRNLKAEKVKIKLEDFLENKIVLESKENKSSETKFTTSDFQLFNKVFILNSRRAFSPFFGKHVAERLQYVSQHNSLSNQRTNTIDQFTYRLFNAQNNKEKFNEYLKKVINPLPDWTIELSESGSYYLKFSKGDIHHSSEGLGEGLISLFFIIDALYDSNKNDVIIIDEPELSLHPTYQKKLINLLEYFSADRQIIISTHSPYFVNLEAIKNGASISRIYSNNSESSIFQMTSQTQQFVGKLLKDYRNPHTLGINARELFFLEDNIILVEGQEDVIFYKKILDELNIELNGDFFGWGMGGAENIIGFSRLLIDLGFNNVVGILDNDKKDSLNHLEALFPNYKFFCIPTDDVRTKKSMKAMKEKKGLLDEKYNLYSEYKKETLTIFSNIVNYFENK